MRDEIHEPERASSSPATAAPPEAASRRPLIFGASIALIAACGIGAGLYALVDWLRLAPSEAEPEQARAEPVVQRFEPRAHRSLLTGPAPKIEEEPPPAVPDDHPFAKTRMTGRVFDIATGEGVPGARIRVRPTFGLPVLGPRSGDGSVVFLSRPDGTYALNGIPPGTFEVEIAASGYTRASSSFKKFSAVEDDEGLDVGLMRGGTIEGRVSTFSGRPVSGAQIYATASHRLSLHAETELVRSAEDGRFLLDSVDARALRVYASHPRYGTAVVKVPSSDAPERVIDIVLEDGRPVRGHVRDSAGPIAGARVTIALQRVAGSMIIASPAAHVDAAVTDRDGAFELVGSEERPLVLSVQAPGYMRASREVSEPSASSADLDIVLEPATEFAGQVTAANGEPAARAEVSLFPSQGRSPLFGSTDAEGRFRIDGVPRRGPYRVRIAHFAHPQLHVVERDAGGEHRYQLTPASRILGSVIDAATKAPIKRYRLSATGPVRRDAAGISVSGSFEIDQLEEGEYTVSLEAEGYEPGSIKQIMVGRGDTVSGLVVKLRAAGGLNGRIRGDLNGVSVVRAWDDRRQVELATSIASDGTFSLTDVPSGSYTLTAGRDGEDGDPRGELRDVRVDSGRVTDGVEIRITR